ncbi:MAG: serine/threonine-protein kinase PknK [Myxococcales bacterium]|nr:serine/threonine-protein kinase PknK [Myxococcales bacterium]
MGLSASEALEAALQSREPIGGRYLLHERLGAGAVGVVFRGTDCQRGGEQVAVKLIDLRAFDAPDDYALQFRRHSRSLAGLSHPNVVRTLDFGKSGHLLWQVMEHFPSMPLRRLLLERGALEIPLAVAIMKETASALEHVHGFGLVHGDLCPNNILVRLEGATPRVALIDFGLVSPDQLVLSHSSAEVAATAYYVAPEQIAGVGLGLDGRADLYSVGATFFELLTGERPFTGESLSAILHRHLVERPSPPSTRRSGVPVSLDTVVLKLLAKDREERYQSASGLLHDLAQISRALETGEDGPIEIGTRDFRRDLSALNEFHGRLTEGQLLRTRLNEAAHGRGSCCLLLGAPGIGKTALARDIAEQAVRQNGLYLVGKCDPLLQEQPLAPLQAALGTLFRSLLSRQKEDAQRILRRLHEQVGEMGQALAALIPSAGPIFPGSAEVSALASAGAQSTRLFLALAKALRAVGEEGRPLLLVLDDAQWADSTTAEFLPHLQRITSDAHLLALVTARSEGSDPEGPLAKAIQFAETGGSRAEVLRLEARAGSLQDQVEVAHHYTHSRDDERAVEHAWLAGEACLRTYASRQAVHYFEVARTRSKKGLSLAAAESLGDAYAAAGELAKAERQHEQVLAQLSALLDRSRVIDKICNLLDRQGRFYDAGRRGHDALEDLGVRLPRTRLGVLVGIVWWFVAAFFGDWFRFLVPRIRRHREKWLLVGRHLVRQTHSMFLINIWRSMYFHLRALALLQRLGPSRELARVMAEHAYLMCTVMRLDGRARRFGRTAVGMARSLGDRAMEVYTRVIEAMAHYFLGELDHTLELLDGFNRANQGVGDLFCQNWPIFTSDGSTSFAASSARRGRTWRWWWRTPRSSATTRG